LSVASARPDWTITVSTGTLAPLGPTGSIEVWATRTCASCDNTSSALLCRGCDRPWKCDKRATASARLAVPSADCVADSAFAPLEAADVGASAAACAPLARNAYDNVVMMTLKLLLLITLSTNDQRLLRSM